MDTRDELKKQRDDLAKSAVGKLREFAAAINALDKFEAEANSQLSDQPIAWSNVFPATIKDDVRQTLEVFGKQRLIRDIYEG